MSDGMPGAWVIDAEVLEVRRTTDGWAGRWEDRAERAEVLRLFGTEWLPLPFTPAASLADLVAFYGPGGKSMSAPVRVVRHGERAMLADRIGGQLR